MSTKMRLLVCVGLLMASTTSFADNENVVPSKITIKENYNNPAILTPVSPYGPPPIMSNFVHQGTNFFFNPQFLLGTNMAPPIGAVVAAVKPNEVQIPVVVEVETPKLPEVKVVVPEIIVEEPIAVIPPPPPPPLIPVMPELPPVLLEKIPPAPLLPPLELPKIPVWIEETVKVVPPCQEEVIISEVKPAAPVVIPQAPSLPPLILPPKIEIREKQPAEPSMSELPVIPEKELSETISKVKFRDEESVQIISAPAPAIPEIDLKINEISNTVDFTDIEKLVSMNEDKTVVMMPPSPEFPVIEIRNPIIDVVITDKNKEHGLLLPDPTDCAHNIVLERILPNMISKKTITKSLEITSYNAAIYPVVSPSLIPGYIIKN